jgi:hypothetical protein
VWLSTAQSKLSPVRFGRGKRANPRLFSMFQQEQALNRSSARPFRRGASVVNTHLPALAAW